MAGKVQTLEPTAVVKTRFDELTRSWKRDTRMTSSTTEMSIHPAYQQIIAMGEQALPLIFRELQQAPSHWFWALKAITGEDPVPTSDLGRMPAMRQAWLDWGRRKGYVS